MVILKIFLIGQKNYTFFIGFRVRISVNELQDLFVLFKCTSLKWMNKYKKENELCNANEINSEDSNSDKCEGSPVYKQMSRIMNGCSSENGISHMTELSYEETVGEKSYEGYPVLKEISKMNGEINRMSVYDLQVKLKRNKLDQRGKKDVLRKRLKMFYKKKLLTESNVKDPNGVNYEHKYFVVIDFEATCDEMVNIAPPFSKVVNQFEEWLRGHNLSSSDDNFTVISLQNMLNNLGLRFEGQPHSGIDDSRNIARVVIMLLRDGATLRVNEMLKETPDSNTFCVANVSKKEYEDSHSSSANNYEVNGSNNYFKPLEKPLPINNDSEFPSLLSMRHNFSTIRIN
ncbi:3'-5' exoribonuclease 1 [Armadillidium nasatum]|uniref:3'-5' exoribonuclease 1 n=1 Tax=Armadillidium nasatum TaxID=96803 RepID=A0A5N5SXG4_9CRUS|nr:3'-5' exoribonuclease 1 [Armadillidium nasatum]